MSTYISDIFDNPYSNHTVALVSTGRRIRAGVIDLDGKWLLEPRYRMITRWGGRYLEVEKENRKRDFWDSKIGRFIFDSLGLNVNNLLVTSSGKTFFVFYNRGNIGLAAEDGAIVFLAKYWSILPFGEDFVVRSREGCELIDIEGNVIVPKGYDDIVYGFGSECIWGGEYTPAYNVSKIPVRKGEEWFYIDRNTGARISNRTYHGLGPFTETGYALFSDKRDRKGIIDSDENVQLTANKYHILHWEGADLLEGYGTIRGKRIHRLINPLGESLIPKYWADIRDYQDSKAISVKGGKNAVFTRMQSGAFSKSFCTPNEYVPFICKDYIVIHHYFRKRTRLSALCTLCNAAGESIFSRDYDRISISAHPDRFFVCEGKKWFLINGKEEVLCEILPPSID